MSAYAQRVNNFHLVVAGLIAAAIAAALVGLAATGTDAPTQLERIRPAGSLVDFPVVSQPEQDEPRTVLPQVAPRRSGGGSSAPQVAQQPSQAVAQPQSDPGNTDVAIQNGTSDTKTESGGASTTNSAEMRVRSGSEFEEEDPEA